MKKITLVFLLIFSSLSVFSQNDEEIDSTSVESHNKWSIELAVGQSKGVKPYSEGYFSSKPGSAFGQIQANSFNFGVRYMFGPSFGLKTALSYDILKNAGNNGSKPFEMQQIGLSEQIVVNVGRILGVEESFNRFGLLVHGGVQIESMTSKTANIVEHDHNYGVTEYNGGLIIGVTPQYRIAKKLALTLDVSNVNNYRQHFNWDGTYSDNANNLAGQQITTSLGLSYSFGNDDIHGDWASYKDSQLKEIDELNKRMEDMETMMNDTDKDGVPDYLDVENNSITGVAVDTKGRMIDLNKNGIPDELEKTPYDGIKEINNNSTNNTTGGNGGNNGANGSSTAANTAMVKKLVNDGYVCAYFDTDKTDPTNASTEGIDFILTYLRNNPKSTVDIIGHADVVGSSQYNQDLSKKRSQAIKDILIKAGISPNRLNIDFKGEDSSVEASATVARRLVRRVTFKVND